MKQMSNNLRMLLKTTIGLNFSWMICHYGVLLGGCIPIGAVITTNTCYTLVRISLYSTTKIRLFMLQNAFSCVFDLVKNSLPEKYQKRTKASLFPSNNSGVGYYCHSHVLSFGHSEKTNANEGYTLQDIFDAFQVTYVNC